MDEFNLAKVQEALKVFKDADRLLLRAENLLFEHKHGKFFDDDGIKKSEVRIRLEKLERDLEIAWQDAYKKYGVDHCFALPVEVYKQICEDWIHKPGQEVFWWLTDEVVKYQNLICPEPKQNPYIMAIGALQMGFNIFKHTIPTTRFEWLFGEEAFYKIKEENNED